MPAITTPEGLPCPQDMGTSPVDVRLMNDEGKGPIEMRAIELDERQIQQLAWTLNAAQAAIFRQWWTETLIYGGAWFAAPANWPSMDGRVVKVRRFTTAPQWRALGAGFWHVSIGAELRGETLLPNEPEVALSLWLDTFTGADGASVIGHAQDVPLNGSIWIANSPFSTVPPELDGAGNASAVASEGGYESNTYTDFSDAVLAFPFTLNIEFEGLHRKPDLEFNGYDSLFVLDMDGAYFSVQWTAGVETIETDPTLQVGFEFDSFELTNTNTGLNTASVLFEADGFTVTFNGVTSEKYAYAVPQTVSRFSMTLGSSSSESTRVAPFATVSRVELLGQIGTLAGETVVTLSPSLVYASDYQADLGAGSLPDEIPSGWDQAGDAVDVDGSLVNATFAEANQSVVGSADDNSAAGYAACEFLVQSLNSDHVVAVGLFPEGGPPMNLNQPYVGWSGLVTYWRMDGEAGGYGSSGNSAPTFAVGDVIGVVFNHLGGDNEIRFYQNGVFRFAYLPYNSTVRPFASTLPA